MKEERLAGANEAQIKRLHKKATVNEVRWGNNVVVELREVESLDNLEALSTPPIDRPHAQADCSNNSDTVATITLPFNFVKVFAFYQFLIKVTFTCILQH